ncbi:MAG: serpin family protein [Paludibacteraceae bacterium]|nr:serpin family protein [Paludibacteraceae bacterium]
MAGNPSQTEINNRQGDFINKFFQSVVMTKNSNENFVFSPVSLNQSLGVLLNGANEKARTEIMQALNYNGLTLSDVNNYNHQILSSSDQSSYNKLLIANGLWISDTIKGKIKRDFLNTASRFYKADIHVADFNNNQEIEEEMRNWIVERTNGFLNAAPSVKPDDVMIGINSTYFNGVWDINPQTPTTETPFKNRDGKEGKCKYLQYKNEKMYCYSNSYFRAIKLFYKDSDYSMIVVLPQLRYGISEEYFQSLKDNDFLQRSTVSHKFDIQQPYFSDTPNNREFNISRFDKASKWNIDPSLSLQSETATGEKDDRKKACDDYYDVDSIINKIEWNKMKFTEKNFDEVLVPHFETKTNIDLKNLLKGMGVQSIFIQYANSLNQITDSLYVSEYEQTARIKVNERGTEAAAVSSWQVALWSSMSPVEHNIFIADHPFIYAIVDEKTGAILFVGRVVNL